MKLVVSNEFMVSPADTHQLSQVPGTLREGPHKESHEAEEAPDLAVFMTEHFEL